jgi:beta-phosphoglucomutase-like phosphatase (HAD superfamily)
MIKAVCFDLHDTLAYYEPPRAEVYAKACQEFGIEVKPRALYQPLLDADWQHWHRQDPPCHQPGAFGLPAGLEGEVLYRRTHQ